MTRYGPWTDAPEQTDNLQAVQWVGITPMLNLDFSALCDMSQAATASGAEDADFGFQWVPDGPWYRLDQMILSFGFGGHPSAYTPPDIPATVAAIEYESDTTWPASFSWISALAVPLTFTDYTATYGIASEDVGLRLVKVAPAEFDYVQGPDLPPNKLRFLSAADVAARPVNDSTTVLAANTTASLVGHALPTDIDTSSTNYWFQFVLVLEQQITHTAPGLTSGRKINRDGYHTGIQDTLTECNVTYQPPRYRFVYDEPLRLRQYPRDDELGGAPRQGGISRSVQASPRQGWIGAYR